MPQLGTTADTLLKVIQDFRLLLGKEISEEIGVSYLNKVRSKNRLNYYKKKLEFLSEVIKIALGRSQTLDSIFERTESIKNQLIRLCDTAIVGYCYWYESMGRQFGLHITPLTVADKFGEQLNNKEAAWILLQPLLKSVAL